MLEQTYQTLERLRRRASTIYYDPSVKNWRGLHAAIGPLSDLGAQADYALRNAWIIPDDQARQLAAAYAAILQQAEVANRRPAGPAIAKGGAVMFANNTKAASPYK